MHRLALLAVLALFVFPAGAHAATQTIVLQSAPIAVSAYGVATSYQLVPHPQVDGYVVGMKADLVDSAGKAVSPLDVMLHHVVFAKLRAPDYTCPGSIAERFYAEGEERMVMALPPGYGYPNAGTDLWGLVYMLMNHHNRPESVSVRYTVSYVTGQPLTAVRPIWMDVHNCQGDPIFTVPGTGGKGSTYTRSMDFRLPVSGRIVAGGGHLHGGGVRLDLTNTTCSQRLFQSLPTWGGVMPMPMMHEPGPTHMSRFETPTGIPVAAGETLRLTAVYDDSIPHMRVMGIMILYFAPGAVGDGCSPEPPLQIDLGSPGPPTASMPLTLLRRPSGPVAKNITSTTVGDYRFGAQRVLLRIGQTFRWRFVGTVEHDVTLATGPEGIASPSMRSGSFSFRFTRAGTYNFYCSLHPARMTQTIVVRKG